MRRCPDDPASSAASSGQCRYHEVDAKTITRIPGITDPWFLGRYGMNLYRGCEHGCLYCDGRSERYYVDGDFARDIRVKRNAVELLAGELARVREPGFLFMGGGVSDAYQPAEERYCLARGALELAQRYRLPVHVLTKSGLVARDLDLLAAIAGETRAILSFSIHTLDEEVRRRFEPAAAPLAERWELLAEAKQRGLGIGVMMMPVLPGISDQADAIEALVARAKAVGADFACFGGLTLRPGIQSDTYMRVIRASYAQHLRGYHRVYRGATSSGAGDGRYYQRINRRFAEASARHDLPGRIPRRLFRGLIPRYTEVAVLLEHRDALRNGGGPTSSALARSGYAIQKWARSRFAKHRSRSYGHGDVEAEFLALVADGTITDLPGVAASAVPVIGELVGS